MEYATKSWEIVLKQFIEGTCLLENFIKFIWANCCFKGSLEQYVDLLSEGQVILAWCKRVLGLVNVTRFPNKTSLLFSLCTGENENLVDKELWESKLPEQIDYSSWTA